MAITFNHNDKFYVSGSNVGIGTDSPQRELHIKGDTWAEMRLEGRTFASGHGATLEFYSEGTALADIYASTDKHLYFRTNGTTERMRITASGNVGIGTTVPYAYLHVKPSNSGSSFSNIEGLLVETGGTSNSYYALQVASAGGGKSFNVTNAGNVGIGTTSPAEKLHVAGDVRADDLISSVSSGGTLWFTRPDNSVNTDNILGTIKFGNSGDTGYENNPQSAIISGVASAAWSTTSTPSKLQFYTTAVDATTATERLIITSEGNVGIGTTSPTGILDVKGASGTVYDTQFRIVASEETGAADTGGSLSFVGHDGSVARTHGAVRGRKENSTVGDYGGYLAFDTRANNAALSEKMRILGNGNVGIGTTGPSSKLHINDGSLQFDKTNTSGGGDFDFIKMGYNGSWSANQGGIAGISVDDATGVVGRYGITYGAGGGRFVVTDLYDGSYEQSGDVFYVRGDGDAYIQGNLGIGDTAPNAKLHIQTDGGSTTTPNTVLLVQANTSTTTLAGGGTAILFRGVSSGGNIQNYEQGRIRTFGYATNNAHGFAIDVKPSASDSLTEALSLASNGVLKLPYYGAGYLKTDANGVVSVDTSTIEDTLDSVTGRGNSTDNSISVGGLEIFQDLSAAETIDYPLVISSKDDNNGINQLGGEGVGIKFRIAGNDATDPGNSLVGASIAAIRKSSSDTESDTHLAFFTSQNDEVLDEAMRIASDGNVGIGKTDPSAPLHINGGSTNQVVKIQSNSAPYIRFKEGGTDVGFIQFGTDTYISNQKDGTLNFRTNNTDKMTILSNGNVGIGTTNPSTGLDVRTSFYSNTTARFGDSRPVYIINHDPIIGFNAYYDSGWKHGTSGHAAYIGASGSSGHIYFYTGDGTSRAANANMVTNERMRIQPNGNVGIATDNPSEKLHVNGNIKLSGVQYVEISSGASITPSAGDWIDIAQLNYGEHHGRIALEWNSLYAPSSSHHGWAEFEVGTYYSASYNYGQDTYVELVKAMAHNNFWLDAVRAVDYGSTVRIQVQAGTAVTQGTFKSYVLNKKQGTVNTIVPAINANSYTVLALANIGTVDGEEVQKAIGNHTRFSSDVAFDEKVGIGTTDPGAKLTVSGSATGLYTNVLLANTNDTDGDATGIGFSMLDNMTYVKGGIFFERTDTGGRGSIHIATTNTTDGTNAGLSDARLTVDKDGNVGIGTTGPENKLSVAGDIGLTGNIVNYDRNDTTYPIIHINDASTASDINGDVIVSGYYPIIFKTDLGHQRARISRQGDFQFYTGTGGSVGMHWDNSDARLGIGTTGPSRDLHIQKSNNGGQVRLQVENTSNTADSTSVISIYNGGADGGDPFLHWKIDAQQDWSMGIDNSDADKLKISKNFGPGTNDYLTVDTSGNVGIGTTSPREKLDVDGDIVTTWGNDRFVGLQYQQGAAYQNGLLLHGDNRSTGVIAKGGAGSTPYIWFGVSEGGNTERMRITKDGNVGINTTNPSEKFNVNGNAQIGTTTSTNNYLRIGGGNASGGRIFIQYNGDSSYIDSYGGHGGTERFRDLTIRSRNLLLQGNNGDGIYINTAGNVGIGTTSPQQALHIKGATNGLMMLEGDNDNGIAGCYYKTEDTDNTMNRTKGFFGFQGNHSWGLGYFTMWLDTLADNGQVTSSEERFRWERDGDFHADGDVIAYSTTTPSDIRLKTDVETIESASEKVSKLRGVEYTWSKGKLAGQREIGLIAQEVEAVVPEVVKEKELPLWDDSGESYKTVDYEKLVALLIESNKELQARVEQLENKLDGFTK